MKTKTMHYSFVGNKSVVLLFTHAAQKLDHAFRPADAHQHDLVAEQDLQGHEHQDLTGATDHLVPHPEITKGFSSFQQYKEFNFKNVLYKRRHFCYILRRIHL